VPVKLPNIDKAVISSDKLRDYLLSRSHPIGRFKAAFFNKLGFSADNWEIMEEALRSVLEGDAQEKDVTEYGNKYEIRRVITGPSGLSVEIVTVWIILKGENHPRFITAYPGERS
jgi:hypothetical protein